MRGPLIAAGHRSMADWASSGSACIPHAERETRKLLSTWRFQRRTLPTMTTTTWRDIADHLTPEQVGELERWQALGDEPSTLLLFAREYASENKHVCSSAPNGASVAFACGSAGDSSRTVPPSDGSSCRPLTCGSAMSRSASCARHCSISDAEVSAAARNAVRITRAPMIQ